MLYATCVIKFPGHLHNDGQLLQSLSQHDPSKVSWERLVQRILVEGVFGRVSVQKPCWW